MKSEVPACKSWDAWQLRVSNRVVALEEGRVTFEAEPLHFEVLVQALGLQGKSVRIILGIA